MASKITKYLRNNINQALIRLSKYETAPYQHAHQLTNVTQINRYPEIFQVVQEQYKDSKKQLRILSFGCSTGEECITLLDYFPNADVIGTDINHRNLKICKKRYGHKQLKFIYSEPELIRAEGPFDLVFCLSVLCRWEETAGTNDCSEIYPFSKFENQLKTLDNLLKSGGHLIIYNSNFRFCDTELYHNYHPVNCNKINESGFVHKFDRNNQRLASIYPECIFKKTKSTPG